jgi:hypothetical protein
MSFALLGQEDKIKKQLESKELYKQKVAKYEKEKIARANEDIKGRKWGDITDSEDDMPVAPKYDDEVVQHDSDDSESEDEKEESENEDEEEEKRKAEELKKEQEESAAAKNNGKNKKKKGKKDNNNAKKEADEDLD